MKKFFGFIIVLLLSFWIIRPLINSGYFPMHDDTQVARVVVMGRALREGQFPVRWVSDLGYGYGYPIYNFYGPLPYYLGGAFYAAGVNSVVATKIMFGFGAILASLTMYCLLEPWFGIVLAITGAVLFSYAPYHAVDIYVRGAVGEYWAIGFLPLVIYGFTMMFDNQRQRKGIIAGGIGLAGVILSHTILGYLTVGLVMTGIVVYWFTGLIRKNFERRMLIGPLAIVAVGLGVSAFFWIPALVEMKSTSVSAMITNAPTVFFDHFVCPAQLWNSPWGFGGSVPGCVDGLSFKLGKPEIGMAILGLLTMIVVVMKKKIAETRSLMVIAGATLIISLLGVLEISKPIWSLVPNYTFIQYPWRLLSFTIVSCGMIGVYPFILIRNRGVRIIVAIALIAICIVVNAKLFRPQYLYPVNSNQLESATDLRFRVSKISDEYLPSGIPKPKNPSEVVRDVIQADSPMKSRVVQNTATDLKVVVESKTTQRIQIQRAYFPGWIYFVNGQPMIPTIAHALPSVVVSEGTSVIESRFTNTPIRLVGNVMSIISIVFIGGILYYGKKTNA